MPSFSQHFRLGKEQPELDFVNIPLDTDIPLFVDPFALSQQVDRWSQDAHSTLVIFFQRAVDLIRQGRADGARRLFAHLHEPNETHLGFSKGPPQGAGIGRKQADQILAALEGSEAVQTGFLSALEECELLVEGIGRDKISDLTTNVIRSHLVAYTQDECHLHGIPTQRVAAAPIFDSASQQWVSKYVDLPIYQRSAILLVPKILARWDPSYDQQQYYRHFVLNFLQREHLEAGSSLVHTLKNGRRVVYKKDLEARFPCAKEFLYEYSSEHPEVLEEYREVLEQLELTTPGGEVDPHEERVVAELLLETLGEIPRGSSAAGDYHRLLVGMVEFIFFPLLINPVKEQEIHRGRKRIDILMSNAARSGIFEELHRVRDIPCAYVAFECKNYRTEVANPELDQLAGRLSVQRGRVGFLCCREFEDRQRFDERCRDTFTDGRGLVMALDDATIREMLEAIGAGDRGWVDRVVRRLVDEVVVG